MLPTVDDVATRLQAVLRTEDLGRNSDSFRCVIERRMTEAGRPISVHGDATVQGDPQIRMLVFSRVSTGYIGRSVLVWTTGRRVRCRELTLIDGEEDGGWTPVAWRRQRDRVIGLNLIHEGNSSRPGIIVLRRQGEGWREEWKGASSHEGYRIRFASKASLDVIVERRSYDFRSLTAPHAGPLLTDVARWRYGNGRYRKGIFHRVPNALDAFDRLVDAGLEGRDGEVARGVPDRKVRERFRTAVRALRRSRYRTVTCPHSTMTDRGQVFGVDTLENSGEPQWFFELLQRNGHWRIVRAASEAAPRKPRLP